VSGAAADRNLLLGIIALQMDFVSSTTLIAAMNAWVLDKSAPLSKILEDRGDLTDSRRSLLEALVEEHLKLHENEPEQSLAALSSIGSVREALSQIADPDVQATLTHVSAARPDKDNVRQRADAHTIVGDSTSAGARFRILRPHARGGLGEVFVARDTELNRDVALKEIQSQFAFDPGFRSRFQFEAEVTGGLEHPGIVPVYGLGHLPDGRPYYAMRFIRGDSLKEAIERFHAERGDKKDAGRGSLELRKLLRRFLDVCNAVDYAHSRGVLHRDIKPGNVMIGKHGETLVVDWGLAKSIGAPEPSGDSGDRTLLPLSASGSAETLPGQSLGTPAYMSPEQAAGDLARLGPRSDVYSLGAMLYYLLTGKSAFEGEVGAVLRKVQNGEFSRPRQCDQSIDKALEAVCLKAMATKPEDRYDSCRALADDTERWMADEPVAAWREPWTRTLNRWTTRHTKGYLTACLLFLIASAMYDAAAGQNLRDAQKDLIASCKAAIAELEATRAELSRARAESHASHELALEAIKTFHTAVSEDSLLKQVQFKELRKRLLKLASDFYGKLSPPGGK
jgi:serine/threonine-protein kinase